MRRGELNGDKVGGKGRGGNLRSESSWKNFGKDIWKPSILEISKMLKKKKKGLNGITMQRADNVPTRHHMLPCNASTISYELYLLKSLTKGFLWPIPTLQVNNNAIGCNLTSWLSKIYYPLTYITGTIIVKHDHINFSFSFFSNHHKILYMLKMIFHIAIALLSSVLFPVWI